MKTKLIGCLLAVGLTACAKPSYVQVEAPKDLPPTKIYPFLNYKGAEAMNSQEVVEQSKQCIFNKMRPNVHYLSVQTEQGKTLVPVSVICEPFV
jgi:hypothetical protein